VSYARFSEDSDVYVYRDFGGLYRCAWCALGDDWSHKNTDATLAHLQEHIAAGHDVPDYCIERLAAEARS